MPTLITLFSDASLETHSWETMWIAGVYLCNVAAADQGNTPATLAYSLLTILYELRAGCPMNLNDRILPCWIKKGPSY